MMQSFKKTPQKSHPPYLPMGFLLWNSCSEWGLFDSNNTPAHKRRQRISDINFLFGAINNYDRLGTAQLFLENTFRYLRDIKDEMNFHPAKDEKLSPSSPALTPFPLDSTVLVSINNAVTKYSDHPDFYRLLETYANFCEEFCLIESLTRIAEISQESNEETSLYIYELIANNESLSSELRVKAALEVVNILLAIPQPHNHEILHRSPISTTTENRETPKPSTSFNHSYSPNLLGKKIKQGFNYLTYPGLFFIYRSPSQDAKEMLQAYSSSFQPRKSNT